MTDGDHLHHLYFLLDFLSVWKERPECLTPMAYQWCSAIAKAVRIPEQREIPTSETDSSQFQEEIFFRLIPINPQDPTPGLFYDLVEEGFSEVGPGCDSVRLNLRLDDISSHSRGGLPEHMVLRLLSTTMEIGFRLVEPCRPWLYGRLDHTRHHEWVFETIFSSYGDDVIADAVCVWLADWDDGPVGSFARYFSKRVERNTPFSQRLRHASISVILRVWRSELEVSGWETVRLLHRLNVDMGDIVSGEQLDWVQLLVEVVRFLAGFGNLSSHYWGLLDKLISRRYRADFSLRDVEVMRLLEGAEDWENLEVWMLVLWGSPTPYDGPLSETLEDRLTECIERSTLTLFARRPSALLKLEKLTDIPWENKDALQRILDQAREHQSPPESLPPPYVSIRSTQRLPVLMPLFF